MFSRCSPLSLFAPHFSKSGAPQFEGKSGTVRSRVLGVIRHCSLFGRPPRILGWKSRSRELEAKLKQVASQTGKVPVEVVRELVASDLDHDQWFRQEVGKGLASLIKANT